MAADEAAEFLTVRETARRLGVHENTVRNWARQGVLKDQRIPGSRFNRFRADDVERLKEQRGMAAASLQGERRTIGPEYVDATDLSRWADRRSSQSDFPELMRRLLVATPNVTNIEIRAGEGVAVAGWDGAADSMGSAFLPSGSLRFEFGVDRNTKGKADDEYLKRVPIDGRSDHVFVFATPRRWPQGQGWAESRRSEHRFADVKVIDADIIEGWLQTSPGVHVWISELLGRAPRHAETLEHWWNRLSNATTPALPLQLFLAGRSEQRDALITMLSGPAQVIAIQAESEDDCKAFIHGALERITASTEMPLQIVIVSSAEVWARTVEQPGRTILIPAFKDPDVSAAIRANHQVLLTLDRSATARDVQITLPRLDRLHAAELLQEAGLDFHRAQRLAVLGRRSMPAMVRRLSRDPSIVHPDWERPPHVAILAPLLLLGSWTTTSKDIQIVERMTAQTWDQVERVLLSLERFSDPPVRRVGDQWGYASPEEAFLLLGKSISATDIKRWREVVDDILLEPDPVLDLPIEEQYLAGVRGVQRVASVTLRAGIAQGLALMGALGADIEVDNGSTLALIAESVVSAVLRRANDDATGKTWQGLADVLQLLAEAAPQRFLEAVDDDLRRPQPILHTMFRDPKTAAGGVGFGRFSPHTYLLWALETVCWSDEYLVDGVRALARLTAFDPDHGSHNGNRPAASLTSILCGWVRNTSATLRRRLEAIDAVCQVSPSVGWDLVVSLLPNHYGSVISHISPKIQDWRPSTTTVPMAEWIEYVHHLVEHALKLAARDARRLATLAEKMTYLPSDERTAVLEQLRVHTRGDALPAEQRGILWEELDRLVVHHQRFASATWALPAETRDELSNIAAALAPTDQPLRFASLFAGHLDLPDIDEHDYERYTARVDQLRQDALSALLQSSDPIGQLEKLVLHAAMPGQVGWSLAARDEPSLRDLIPWFESDQPRLKEAAESWVRRKLMTTEPAWFADALRTPGLTDVARCALITNAATNGNTWAVLESSGNEADVDFYWTQASIHVPPPDDLDQAVQQLLQHGRAWTAIEILAHAVHFAASTASETNGPSADLIITTLDTAVDQTVRPNERSTMTGNNVKVILDYLAATGASGSILAKYEFAYYRLLEHYREPRALNQALATEPSLFVELAKRVYRGKTEPPANHTEQESDLATQSWWVLKGWHGFPGRREDGSLDPDTMASWVRVARLEFSGSDRADIGDELIGQAFACSPRGDDGVWPAEPVRTLIETIGSRELENGFVIGKFNSRGVTTRDPYEGGAQEHTLAQQFRGWSAATKTQWPRTSRILRDLAETYERDARREDIRADQYADQD